MHNSIVYNSANWLDRFLNDFDRPTSNTVSFRPAVDIFEEKNEYILRAELPGVAKENVKIEVKEKHLTISGKKESTPKSETNEYRYVETHYGSFSRAFELPKNVNGDAVKAEFTNGVLVLHIPKVPEASPRTVEIA